MAKTYVITIARQFGSLGREIGKKLANELGINYYDRDILERAAENMGLPVSSLSLYDETSKNPFARMLYPLGLGTATTQDKLYEMERSLILEHAENESCVIVGRCADYILRNYKNVLNVFVYAPYETRIRNSIISLGLEEPVARRMVDGVDKARNRYYKIYGGGDYESFKTKHLLLDSSMMEIDDTVAVLKDVAIRRFNLK